MKSRTACVDRLSVRVAISMIVVAALVGASACTSGDPSKPEDRVSQVLRDATEQHKIPGIVAMVADASGVLYEGTAGKHDTQKDLPMRMDSIFAIASMTKPVTSVAVMQLVERGRVKLDEPASIYLPELSKLQVLEGFDDAGKPRLRPAKSSPTVRQLLAHTSGFGYEFFNPLLQKYAATGAIPSATRGDDGFLMAPLLFDPGTRFEYGISTDWLGRLVEKVSGQTLEDYFREHIFTPLGMSDTFFNVPAAKESRVVALHVRRGDAFVQPPPQPRQPVRFFSGGGGLYSTAGDYMKFTQMLLAGGALGGKRILRAETVAEMSRNQIGAIEMPPMRSLAPQLATEQIRVPGSIGKFGLGFGITTQPAAGERSVGSYSWGGIFNTLFWVDPQAKICAVLMMQVLPFSDDATHTAAVQFERAVYAAYGTDRSP